MIQKLLGEFCPAPCRRSDEIIIMVLLALTSVEVCCRSFEQLVSLVGDDFFFPVGMLSEEIRLIVHLSGITVMKLL